jgi:hypothetical protein
MNDHGKVDRGAKSGLTLRESKLEPVNVPSETNLVN